MLEKASDDADDADAVANSRHSGPEAADSAHDQVDSHAGAGSVVKALDYLRIDERIHLGDDSRRLPRFSVFRFAPDHVAESLSHVARREAENARSEEHTSELQSLRHLVCRPLLEKKNIR